MRLVGWSLLLGFLVGVVFGLAYRQDAEQGARLWRVAPEEWRQALRACTEELVVDHATWAPTARAGNWRPGQ